MHPQQTAAAGCVQRARPDEARAVLGQALAFFDRNPDEILTRADLALKFDCSAFTASIVAKALIREGISRNQLPRGDANAALRKRREAKGFPESLAPAEHRAVQALMHGASIAEAAAAAGVKVITIETHLKVARRKAGVKKTAGLVELYRKAVMS